MDGCGFCEKAKKELQPQIKSGVVVVKNARQARNDGVNVSGFPHFKNTKNGLSHTGYLDKNKLFEKLEVSVVENYKCRAMRNYEFPVEHYHQNNKHNKNNNFGNLHYNRQYNQSCNQNLNRNLNSNRNLKSDPMFLKKSPYHKHKSTWLW